MRGRRSDLPFSPAYVSNASSTMMSPPRYRQAGTTMSPLIPTSSKVRYGEAPIYHVYVARVAESMSWEDRGWATGEVDPHVYK